MSSQQLQMPAHKIKDLTWMGGVHDGCRGRDEFIFFRVRPLIGCSCFSGWPHTNAHVSSINGTLWVIKKVFLKDMKL